MTTSTLPENFEFILDTSEPLPPKPPKGVTASMLWQVIIYLATLLQQVKLDALCKGNAIRVVAAGGATLQQEIALACPDTHLRRAGRTSLVGAQLLDHAQVVVAENLRQLERVEPHRSHPIIEDRADVRHRLRLGLIGLHTSIGTRNRGPARVVAE